MSAGAALQNERPLQLLLLPNCRQLNTRRSFDGTRASNDDGEAASIQHYEEDNST